MAPPAGGEKDGYAGVPGTDAGGEAHGHEFSRCSDACDRCSPGSCVGPVAARCTACGERCRQTIGDSNLCVAGGVWHCWKSPSSADGGGGSSSQCGLQRAIGDGSRCSGLGSIWGIVDWDLIGRSGLGTLLSGHGLPILELCQPLRPEAKEAAAAQLLAGGCAAPR